MEPDNELKLVPPYTAPKSDEEIAAEQAEAERVAAEEAEAKRAEAQAVAEAEVARLEAAAAERAAAEAEAKAQADAAIADKPADAVIDFTDTALSAASSDNPPADSGDTPEPVV